METAPHERACQRFCARISSLSHQINHLYEQLTELEMIISSTLGATFLEMSSDYTLLVDLHRTERDAIKSHASLSREIARLEQEQLRLINVLDELRGEPDLRRFYPQAWNEVPEIIVTRVKTADIRYVPVSPMLM